MKLSMITNAALALTMTVGGVALTGCGDKTVDSTETVKTNGNGTVERKTTETKVDSDTGAVKKETTVEKHTNP